MKATWIVIALVAWAALVCAGYGVLIQYSATAGTGNQANSVWPSDSRMVRKEGMPILVVFMHPMCPCSRATLEELSNLMARIRGQVDVLGVFVRPARFHDGWERTELWRDFIQLPGARVIADPNGEEARRFGAATSGYTLLFDSSGSLIFRGGITVARGHQGNSIGKDAILRWFDSGQIEIGEASVFGCSLFDD